jgi:hypothetical protein
MASPLISLTVVDTVNEVGVGHILA